MESTKFLVDSDRPSWLTEDFATELFRKEEDDPCIRVCKLDINFTLGKGENFTSVIKKLNVSYYNGKSQLVHKSLFLKSFPQDLETQKFLKNTGLFDKEIRAYKKLIPAMAGLTETTPVSPKFYPTEREDAVLLEDMSSRGFRMADRKKRLDLDHSFLALKALAHFHGLSFALVQMDPLIVDLFPESLYSDRFKEMSRGYVQNMYNNLASTVETWPGFERFAEKIRFRMHTMADVIAEKLLPIKDDFNVLNHGDFWVNNILFRYNEITQEPEEVCLIDLQLIRYGSPALDLQNFFATSMADGIREEYEDVLLEVYHKSLAETLSSMSVSPSTYTLEDLKRDFKDKGIFGFHSGCVVISAVTADSSEGSDLDNLTEESKDNSALNQMKKTLQGKRFKDVFSKFLLYYENKSVI